MLFFILNYLFQNFQFDSLTTQTKTQTKYPTHMSGFKTQISRLTCEILAQMVMVRGHHRTSRRIRCKELWVLLVRRILLAILGLVSLGSLTIGQLWVLDRLIAKRSRRETVAGRGAPVTGTRVLDTVVVVVVPPAVASATVMDRRVLVWVAGVF